VMISLLALGGHMFQALLTKRAINRSYKRTVDDCLTVLFCGFPRGLLPSRRFESNPAGIGRRDRCSRLLRASGDPPY
jgi:hypothetical protein